ncbi:hypothetical protein GN956_G15231 [Arapaima gigas]
MKKLRTALYSLLTWVTQARARWSCVDELLGVCNGWSALKIVEGLLLGLGGGAPAAPSSRVPCPPLSSATRCEEQRLSEHPTSVHFMQACSNKSVVLLDCK